MMCIFLELSLTLGFGPGPALGEGRSIRVISRGTNFYGRHVPLTVRVKIFKVWNTFYEK